MKYNFLYTAILSMIIIIFSTYSTEHPSIQPVQIQPRSPKLNLFEQQQFLITIVNQLEPSDILTIINQPDHFQIISKNITTLLEIQKNEPETVQLVLKQYNQKLDQDAETFINWLTENQTTFPPINSDFIEKYFPYDDQILKKYLIMTYKAMYEKALAAQIKKNEPGFTTRELRFSKKIFESYLPYLNRLPDTQENQRLADKIQKIINNITIKLTIKFISKVNIESSTEDKIKYINKIIFLANNLKNTDKQDRKNIEELRQNPSLQSTIANELSLDPIQKNKFKKAWPIIYGIPTKQYKEDIVLLNLEQAIAQHKKRGTNIETQGAPILPKTQQATPSKIYIEPKIKTKNNEIKFTESTYKGLMYNYQAYVFWANQINKNWRNKDLQWCNINDPFINVDIIVFDESGNITSHKTDFPLPLPIFLDDDGTIKEEIFLPLSQRPFIVNDKNTKSLQKELRNMALQFYKNIEGKYNENDIENLTKAGVIQKQDNTYIHGQKSCKPLLEKYFEAWGIPEDEYKQIQEPLVQQEALEQPEEQPTIGWFAKLQAGITTITSNVTNFFKNIPYFFLAMRTAIFGEPDIEKSPEERKRAEMLRQQAIEEEQRYTS
jgi:5'(3')-deoxyribonucleotidase